MAKYRGSSNYIGAWHYVLLDILYAIPVIGLIMLLVHSFSQNNENRRHYARSYFARFLTAVIIIIAVVLIMYFTLGEAELNRIINEWNRIINQAPSAVGTFSNPLNTITT